MFYIPDFHFKGILIPRDKNVTRYIVIHHSGVTSRHTAKDIHRWHVNKGWIGIGYHFFIDKEGNICNGRPLWAVGAHTYGYNRSSIGICLEGNFNKDLVNEKQTDAAAMLIALLCLYYSNTTVIRHCDLRKTTDCPGKKFPFRDLCLKVMRCKQLLSRP